MGLDERIFVAANQALGGPATTWFFAAVTWLGDGLVLAVLILVPMYLFDRRRFRAHVVPLVVSVALGGLAVAGMKLAFDRPRPPAALAAFDVTVRAPLGVPPDRSFPSGHAETAFGAATYLSFLYPHFAPLFILLAALVGLSRLALGVHFPFDVAVGAAVGAAFSAAAYLMARRRAPPGSGRAPDRARQRRRRAPRGERRGPAARPRCSARGRPGRRGSP